MMTADFIGIDWGTTRIRAWAMTRAGEVLAESKADEGLLTATELGFETVLQRHLDILGTPHGTPIMMCGMVGSRQGWVEAAYARAPAPLDHIAAQAVSVPFAHADARIMPGVALYDALAPDVMRGEETQLMGIDPALLQGPTLVAMPGTHAKWVRMEDRNLSNFATWLTGEMYSIFATQSILKHAIQGEQDHVSVENPVFQAWVQRALTGEGGVMGEVFKIRAATLLNNMSAVDAAAALSGYMIGNEVRDAKRRFARDVDRALMVGSGTIGALYCFALEEAGFSVHQISAEASVQAGLTMAADHLLFSAPQNTLPLSGQKAAL